MSNRTIIIKNTTLSVVNYGAYKFPASSQRDMSDALLSDYQEDLATLLADIASGDTVVNNGSSDLDAIRGRSHLMNDIESGSPVVIEGSLNVLSTEALNFPIGTTAQRPSSPVAGDSRFNTDIAATSVFELYDGTSWVVTSFKWSEFTADTGSASAGANEDSFAITGGAAMDTTISGDEITIKVEDNPVLPGTEGTVPPVGTTAQRPVSPADGELRFNSTTNLMEYYNGTEWVNLSGTSSGVGTVKGNILGYHFLEDSKEGDGIVDMWLGTTTRHISSDEVQYVMPFDGIIVALTYGNSISDSDTDVYIEFSEPGSGTSNSTKFLWEIRDARVAHNSEDSGSGGPFGLTVTKGGKLGVFVGDASGSDPENIVLSVFIQWTNEPQEAAVESYSGNLTAPT
jgi:hypothetical protein